MPSPRARLEEALASPRNFHQLLTPNEHGGLAERIEEALLLGRRDLADFSATMELLATAQIQRLSEEDRAKLVCEDATPLRRAYEIGALSFAHLLVAQAAARRAPDRIEDLAQSAPLAPYVRALADRELSNSELSNLLNETQETVSRKLRRLRVAGIADFRRDGRISTNFLTSLGRTLAGSEPLAAPEPEPAEEDMLTRRVLVQRIVRNLPDFLRSQPVMDVESGHLPASKVIHGK